VSGLRRLRLHSSVRARLGNERGFLFDERSGRVYSLTSTAAFALARLQRSDDGDDIVAAVVKAFQVDTVTAQRDLNELVAQLLGEGLATVEGEDAHG
jgi:coenzyme PQQ synthesis protein D (PqqD)